ncbi:GNAT family N-acetyltransferase [Blastopirellula marina]|uniref:GNAT family N-acetyltransferase n=1 Tax=Blastopirellula marina TaxID=124 RepID=A0A2S8GTZ2_9BACT|nr:GNAT family N-acetyltransferase [Blastopirellula marina]PQO47898.1 GNAT family N-acetyltransferase [Blastopirellula marina]
MIEYQLEPNLSVDEYLGVLLSSGLSERRPADDREKLTKMVQNADIILTARSEGKLIGISRCMTDFAHATYLADLAVDRAFQKQGIGRELITKSHEAAGTHTILLLLAAPTAASYYPHVGMQKHDSCWIIPRSSS